MKVKDLVISSFSLLVLWTVQPGEAHAAELTAFTATHYWDPFGVLGGAPVGSILSLGTVTCPGFEPTSDPMSPCPPGSNMHLRGMVHVARVESSDPRVTGWITVGDNANYRADSTGPEWGTFSIALDGALGTWEGVYHMVRASEDDHWIAVLHATAHGTGGVVDGMQMRFTNPLATYTPFPIAYFSTVEGTLVDPKGE